MKMFVLLSASLCMLATSSDAGELIQDTPVTKVIELLNEMLDKGKTDMHDEQEQYAAYKRFCDDTTADKQKAIADAGQQINTLTADIEQADSQLAQLTGEIHGHRTDVATLEADKQNATEMRAKEKADYTVLTIDLSESIDALERAIQTLKAQDYARAQEKLTFLASSKLVPETAKHSLELFLSQVDETGAPEANAYEFQSGTIVEMLERLLEKFEKELATAEKEEVNSKHNFNLVVQNLDSQIALGEKDNRTKTALRADTLQFKKEAEGELAVTKATKAEDEEYLSTLTSTCTQKGADYDVRQTLRKDELAAIEKAVDILSSPAVAGTAATHLSLVQVRRTSLAAFRSASSNAENFQKAREYLEQQSQKLDSQLLSAVAGQVRDDDPFAKVKQMIQDLVVKLMEQANSEADHHAWCSTEMSVNEQVRTDTSAAVDKLQSDIDSLNATVAQLTADVARLTQQVAGANQEMADATEMRAKEKATNAKTVDEAKQGQAATARAIVVLKEFYGTASTATALVQQEQQPVAPEIFDSPYQGMQGESTGVIGLLEVIMSDFARLEADTEAEEAAAQKEYESLMADSKLDSTVNQKEIEHKVVTRQDKEKELANAHAELEDTQEELDAALAYYDKLKPSCVDAGSTYNDRAARREEEIQSLKEALTILSG